MSDSFSRRKALTYVACTLLIVLGLPAGAFAVVAGSNAFITDPATGHRAHVNASGQLLVNTGGSAVSVGNTVRTTQFPGKPYTAFCFSAQTTSGVAHCSKTIPAGETFVAQSLSLDCFAEVSNFVVSPQVQDWNAALTTMTALYTLPTGSEQHDYSGWYETPSLLTGTEYFTGTMIFNCNASRQAYPAATAYVVATAQGYLFP